MTAALRRARPALVLLAAALVLTAARAVPMAVLAGRGLVVGRCGSRVTPP
ncbi:hypothetical protein [Micromonospora sp. NPDC085948]